MPSLHLDMFNEHKVVQAMRSFPNGSEGGSFGLTTKHIRVLVDVPKADKSSSLAATVSGLATDLATGPVHGNIVP